MPARGPKSFRHSLQAPVVDAQWLKTDNKAEPYLGSALGTKSPRDEEHHYSSGSTANPACTRSGKRFRWSANVPPTPYNPRQSHVTRPAAALHVPCPVMNSKKTRRPSDATASRRLHLVARLRRRHDGFSAPSHRPPFRRAATVAPRSHLRTHGSCAKGRARTNRGSVARNGARLEGRYFRASALRAA